MVFDDVTASSMRDEATECKYIGVRLRWRSQ